MCEVTNKYTIKQFREEYATEEMCLDKVFKIAYPDLKVCPKCKQEVKYKRIPTRMCYHCPKCYNQLFPMAGTILEKSTTSLMHWFYAMFLFTASKNGLSAMELCRQTGVTYKTAWRMLKQIRTMIKADDSLMEGVISADETFVGGKNKNRHWDKKVEQSQGRSFKDKTPVLGLIKRNEYMPVVDLATGEVIGKKISEYSKVRGFVVRDTKSETLKPIILEHVNLGSTLVTDEWIGYKGLRQLYNHQVVDHGRKQYMNDKGFSSNNMENFWSIVKRTLNGSYIHVSRKYLQLYVNECVFRFNNRSNKQIFNELVSCLA